MAPHVLTARRLGATTGAATPVALAVFTMRSAVRNVMTVSARNVNESLLRVLSSRQHRVVFAGPGSTHAELLNALKRHGDPARGVRTIASSCDVGALFMADGYAKVSGDVGVCMASCPWDVPGAIGGTSLAAADGPGLWSFGEQDRNGQTTAAERAGVDAANARESWWSHFEALFTSARPLLVLGTGARRALGDPRRPSEAQLRLRQLVDAVARHALPVVTSPSAKGIFPESHCMSLGCHGVAGNRWSQHYMGAGLSTMMLVGSHGPGRVITECRWRPGARAIHVDAMASTSEIRGLEITELRADVVRFLDALIGAAQKIVPGAAASRRREALLQRSMRGARWGDERARASLAIPLKPQRVMSELQAVLNHADRCKSGVNLFCELGAGLGWAWEHLVVDPPHRFWCSTRTKTRGWATSAVIGGKLANPERPAIAVLGADAMLVHGTEISAAVRQGVGAVWLILCEARRHSGTAPGVADQVAAFAETLGARVHHVERPGALVRGLGEALAAATCSEPRVLVAYVDADEAPASSYPLVRRQRRG